MQLQRTNDKAVGGVLAAGAAVALVMVLHHPAASGSNAVERIQDIVFHISWSLKIMLGLTLLVGFSVLFSIASQQAHARKWDIGLLKSLGAPLGTIAAGLLLQFALIAALAAGFGFAVSLAFSRIISHYLFSNLWFFDWRTPTLLLIASVATSVLVTWISVSRTLKTQARELLNR